MRIVCRSILLSLLVALPAGGIAAAQDDVADVSSETIEIDGDARQTFYLVGPAGEEKPPEEGFGLVVILPGGDGSASFHPFVKRIYKNALPKGYVVAQPVAVKWTDEQAVIWPTRQMKVEGQKRSTEEFIQAVIAEVKKRHKIDPSRVFTLSWSSSGPAAYAASLTPECGVTGSFVAMSVFKPDQLPPLSAAKGRAYFIYHSREDRVCPFRMAEEARDKLTAAEAVVEFREYAGGHGWRGPMYKDIREGIAWLEKNAKRAPRGEETPKPSVGG